MASGDIQIEGLTGDFAASFRRAVTLKVHFGISNSDSGAEISRRGGVGGVVWIPILGTYTYTAPKAHPRMQSRNVGSRSKLVLLLVLLLQLVGRSFGTCSSFHAYT